jgi:hypothetical protein
MQRFTVSSKSVLKADAGLKVAFLVAAASSAIATADEWADISTHQVGSFQTLGTLTQTANGTATEFSVPNLTFIPPTSLGPFKYIVLLTSDNSLLGYETLTDALTLPAGQPSTIVMGSGYLFKVI